MSETAHQKTIAARQLSLRQESGNIVSVDVLIGRPEYEEASDAYVCTCTIVGLGENVVKSTKGEDSVQALFLALQYIGTVLEYYRDAKGHKLWWLDEQNRDLGFPPI